MNDDPKSAYIHIPFCRRRCGYCNFALVADRDYLVDRFLDALETEIGWLDRRYELETLFLGGGTPSHLTVNQLKRLKQIVNSRFDIALGAEVTSECNPNDLNAEKAEALASFGINRISLGIQSMHPAKLERLERTHQPADVIEAIKVARQFAKSVSIDLIFATPGETLSEWQADLETAMAMEPDHLSTYELTYEKGTSFWSRLTRGSLTEASEDLKADMYESTIRQVRAASYTQYEVSSFAKPGHSCRHNENYWTGEPYFAFGPGASSYLNGVRTTNHQGLLQYLKSVEAGSPPTAVSEKLSPLDSAKELLTIGLRRVAGVDEADFHQRTGFTVDELLQNVAASWIQEGLLCRNGNRWQLTDRGRMVCDALATRILTA